MTRLWRTSFIGFLIGLTGVFQVQAQVPQPPEIAARAYLLVDLTAQQVLAELDADKPIEPASLTKLMTAYIVFDALKSKKITLQQTLGVSERAWKMPGSRMFVDPKMKVPVEDLIKGHVLVGLARATTAGLILIFAALGLLVAMQLTAVRL